MKQILFATCACLLFFTPLAAQAQQYGDFTYTSDGFSITITGYTGPGGNVIIPAEIDGLPVTWLESGLFYLRTELTSVSIPDSVFRIPDQAFLGCSGLRAIQLPYWCISIGFEAFRACTSLANFELPDSVSWIEEGALSGCTSLTNITVGELNRNYKSVNGVLFDASQTMLVRFPGGRTGSYVVPTNVTFIASRAFDWSVNLTGVTLPDAVNGLGERAFYRCNSLSDILIPKQLTNIWAGALGACASLTSITVDPLNTAYASLGGVLFDKQRLTLWQYPAGLAGSYTVPDGVRSIQDWTFSRCLGLTSVSIPETVTNVGSYAFYFCSSLTRVLFLGDAPLLGSAVFDGDYLSTVYYLPGTLGWGPSFGGRPTMLWMPFAYTQAAAPVRMSSATLNGMASPNGLPVIAWFEWGTSTNYEHTTEAQPVGSSFGVVHVSVAISSLAVGSVYHSRLVVSNTAGFARGMDQRFTTGSSIKAWDYYGYGVSGAVPPSLTNVVTAAAGASYSLAMTSEGRIVGWGEDGYGQTDVPGNLTNAAAVAAGTYHGLALTAGGHVVGWGANGSGQAEAPPGLSNAVAIAAGSAHSLALTADGRAVCWGDNSYGQTNLPSGLDGLVAVAAGRYHSLGLASDGRVVGWGDDTFGQTEAPSSLSNVVAIAAGPDSSIAVTAEGRVVVWGDGSSQVPTGLSNVIAAVGGVNYSLALKADGSLVAWSQTAADQTPSLHGVVAIAGGLSHALVLAPASSRVQRYAEPFDAESSAKVRVNASGGANMVLNYVNYSNLVVGSHTFSLPEAPGSVAVSGAPRRGLLMRCNYGGTARILNVLTAETPGGSLRTFNGNYRVKFDLWLSLDPASTSSSTGTTEVGLWAVGTDGGIPIGRTKRTTAGLVGTWGWLSVDGGLGTSAGSGDASFWSNTTEVFRLDSQYDNSYWRAAWPGSPRIPGAPGTDSPPWNSWTAVEIEVADGKFTVSYNGMPFFTRPSGSTSGAVAIGYEDPFTGSASWSPDWQWAVFDNLVVEMIGQPPAIISPVRLSASEFQFTVTSAPNTALDVLRTTDLQTWQLYSRITNSTGAYVFTDLTATNGQSFYRVQFP